MMTDKDRLAHIEGLRQFVRAARKGVGLGVALVCKALEPFGLHRGALGQGHLFRLDLASQFDGQVLALRRPPGRDEQLLFRSPFEPGLLDLCIGLGIKAR